MVFDKQKRDDLLSDNFNYQINYNPIKYVFIRDKNREDTSIPGNLELFFKTLFESGNSAITSYIFTKSFYLILGIIIFCTVGIPIFSAVMSITLIYISLNLLYNILLYPLLKEELRQELFKIIKNNGILLALIFTGLVINSIRKSKIFGRNTHTAFGIMVAIYAILVITNLLNFKKKQVD